MHFRNRHASTSSAFPFSLWFTLDALGTEARYEIAELQIAEDVLSQWSVTATTAVAVKIPKSECMHVTAGVYRRRAEQYHTAPYARRTPL